MNRLYIQILPLIIYCISFNNVQAQVTDVCGTDTIVLRVDNFQYGTMRWERSYDMVIWEVIPNQNDTVYKFLPTESMYYRAAVKFSECDPEFSDISFVQIPPQANAGSDRIAPGQQVRLFANEESGAMGTWTIIEGSNGSLSSYSNPTPILSGTDSLYRLVWTLTNACGTSSDTVSVRFRETVFSDNLSIVDTTDTFLSDSADMANGLFIIEFNQPAPTITDSTILVGMAHGGFLRKVDSFTVNGNVYTMQTSQATLEDITEEGAYDFGHLFSLDTTYTDSKNPFGYTRLNRMPTRQELLTDPRFQTGENFYYLINQTDYAYPGVTMNTNTSKGNAPLIDLNFDYVTLIDTMGIKLELTGNYKYTPNFVADLDYSTLWGLKYFKIGSSNSIEEKSLALTLTATAAIEMPKKKYKKWKTTWNYLIIIGYVPVLVDIEFVVNGELEAKAAATMTAAHTVTERNVTTSYVEYDNNTWGYTYNNDSQSNVDNSLNFVGELTQSFKIGPVLSFRIYKVLGPYVDLKFTEQLRLCASPQLDWQAGIDLGAELKLGAKATILGKDLVDVYKSWQYEAFKYRFPDSLEIWSGNNQIYFLGDTLPNDVKVMVHSNRGIPLPYAPVRFAPQTGGSVLDSLVYTDILGHAQTKWIPGDSLLSRLEVSVLDCDSSHIKNSPITFIAHADTNVCAQSTLSAVIDIIDENTVSVEAIMGVEPYTYSTDGQNFVTIPPEVTVVPDTTYKFVVKDDEGCEASVNYFREHPCSISDLSVDLWVMGDSIIAQGSGGTPPYLYSIDDTLGFSVEYIFENRPIGTHTVFVKDSEDCIKSRNAEIFDPCDVSGLAIKLEIIGDSIIVTAIGGTPPYLYSINDNINFSPVYTFGGMPVGTHVVYVMDDEGCHAMRYAVIDHTPIICDPFTDPRDNRTYQVVQIGDQCWMAENLYYSTGNSWCYNDHPSCNNTAYLYDFYTAINACPAGWRLPTDAEWTQLTDTLGGIAIAGGILKDQQFWTQPNTGATNQYGFSARPGGARTSTGTYMFLWNRGYWWTATSDQPGMAWSRQMHYDSAEVIRNEGNMTMGFSVRCIKD